MQEQKPYQSIDAFQTAQYLQTNYNVPILDLRDKEFFDQSHFENATWIKLENLDKLCKLHSDEEKTLPILVHCGAGVRSPKASQSLVENGFTNVICSSEGYKTIQTEIYKL
jgi:rhodanese-related sulfurtransferase